jgi:hypothetical protein
MISKLKQFFDGECCRVLGAGGIGGTWSGLSADKQIGLIVGVLTAIYISIKIFKQLRFWDKPDKD